jgi:hypothetical protein
VLDAIAANSALAENAFKAGGTWTVNAAALGTASANAKALTMKAAGKSSLVTTIGSFKFDLTMGEIACLGCKIENKAGETQATIGGVLAFKKVTLSEPATGCSVPGGEIQTKELTATLGMGGSGTGSTLRFTPATGPTSFTLILEGASCAIAGSYKFTGTFFAEATNPTNITVATQEFKMSEAIQKSAGTATSLQLGGNAAFLTGSLTGTLSTGEKWGGTE